MSAPDAPARVAAAVGVVVLTMGTRPDDLARGIRSVLDQRGVATDVVCVGNGWDPATADPPLPDGVKTLHLPENLGIPAGRNRGVPEVAGDVLFFLDDDAFLPSDAFLADGCRMLAAATRARPDPAARRRPDRPRLAASVDPAHPQGRRRALEQRVLVLGGRRADAARRCSTRPAAGPTRSSTRTRASSSRGGCGTPGHVAWYAGDLEAGHPVIDPTRHAYYYRLNARNRVWLARRNLPAVLVPLYVGSWTAIQVLRWARNPSALKAWFGGWRAGLARASGGATADVVAHGVAHDPRGAAVPTSSEPRRRRLATLGRWD